MGGPFLQVKKMTKYAVGQRWISEMEPELGLGKIEAVEHRRVHVLYPSGDVKRLYAKESAPIKRVRFHPGDRLRSVSGDFFTVETVDEADSLLVYKGEGHEIREDRLSGLTAISTPRDRLMAGQVDSGNLFDLRFEVLENQHRHGSSEVRGFSGPRVQLLAHQFFIAGEVSSRRLPRVLLSDETGLGKTIEACLIMHRLILQQRVSRVLIVVPDALVVQWFVELVRRFNMLFSILDEDYVNALSHDKESLSKGLEESFVLCSLSFLTASEKAAALINHTAWDLLVVDEAHHLKVKSPSYERVKTLSRKISRLLLLTATPRQLGVRSHFARLRLLDPDRYHDFDAFAKAENTYHETAVIADRILNRKKLTPKDLSLLSTFKGKERQTLDQYIGSEKTVDGAVVADIVKTFIDRHGVGRVMFRNTRDIVTGFPGRTAKLSPLLPLENEDKVLNRLRREFKADQEKNPAPLKFDLENDLRITWLADFLRRFKDEKVLLICTTQEKAKLIHSALQKVVNIKAGLFHQGMSLVQRDRNAAWFSDPKGARLLICSEIGSEGRNFQFAHHLVLFDLPVDPELLEQRIGRLDRIGQTSTIHIHVPFVKKSPYEILARWFHEGIGLFEKNIPGSGIIMAHFKKQILKLAHDATDTFEQDTDQLIKATRTYAKEQIEIVKAGRDRLLEINSFHPEKADKLIQKIRNVDADGVFAPFAEKLLDSCGIQMEPVTKRTYRLKPDLRYTESLPGFRHKKRMITCDREKALDREDLDFLTWDHPMITGAMELFLGTGKGNSAFAVLPDQNADGLFLELVFVFESIAPPSLCVGRFLPPTPIRVVVDHLLKNRTPNIQKAIEKKGLKEGNSKKLSSVLQVGGRVLVQMVEKGRQTAKNQTTGLLDFANRKAENTLDQEIDRLYALKKINPNIRDNEIDAVKKEKQAVLNALSQPVLRLDAARLIMGIQNG